MSQIDELWIVEWSHSQGCFHVDMLKTSLATNAQAYLEGRSLDYVPLAVCSSHEQASGLARKFRKWKKGKRAA